MISVNKIMSKLTSITSSQNEKNGEFFKTIIVITRLMNNTLLSFTSILQGTPHILVTGKQPDSHSSSFFMVFRAIKTKGDLVTRTNKSDLSLNFNSFTVVFYGIVVLQCPLSSELRYTSKGWKCYNPLSH